MGGLSSLNKGKRAEREVVNLLQPLVSKVALSLSAEPITLRRNLMQSAGGGHDIVGLPWLALEVKHHESFQINGWWEQAKRQAISAKALPVLMYKKNHAKWRIMMFGELEVMPGMKVKCPVDIPLATFLVWFEAKVKAEVKRNIEKGLHPFGLRQE